MLNIIKKKYLKNNYNLVIIIFCLLIILFYYFNKTKIEKFISIIDKDDNIILDILKNKEVDIVCSGPSSKNIKLKTDIVICANSSILNKSINKKDLNKTVIWMFGPGYRNMNIDDYENNYIITRYINNLNVIPDYIYFRYAGAKTLDKFNFLKKKLKEKYPQINVYKWKSTYLYSTGSACIQFALQNDISNAFISGYMDWVNSKYEYNKDFSDLQPEIPSKARHGREDKKHIDNLSKKDKSKLKPIKKCGLYEYLNR